MADEPLRRLARAKVNLSLHVTGQRADGYHLLDSLVVFPDVGDVLEAEASHGLSLTLGGRFAGELDSGGANSVIKAAEALGKGRGAALHLQKNLPVASGIGGGSADAAAALDALSALWGVDLPADRGISLGADVPVCLHGAPVRMRGIGELLEPVPALPDMGILLVNSGASVSTAQVFKELARRDNPEMGEMPDGWDDLRAFITWLGAQRNDMQAAAIKAEPGIARVLRAIEATEGVELARMSGSGGTCFGLYADRSAAMNAAQQIRGAEPEWWCVAAGL